MKTSTKITHKLKLEDQPPTGGIGDNVGECEVCGAAKVTTRTAMRGRSSIEACNQCIEKMGLEVSISAQERTVSPRTNRPTNRSASGYAGIARKGNDIMDRRGDQLSSDFAATIRQAREEKGWDQRELAKRMAERVNIIQHTEGGKRPTDSVIKKFERILEIKLMMIREVDEETPVRRSSNRPMTMADLYEEAKKELRGD